MGAHARLSKDGQKTKTHCTSEILLIFIDIMIFTDILRNVCMHEFKTS